MFEKIKIYMRSKDKVYIYMNEEILFFENQELSSILENLREESETNEEMAVSVILHYPYFLFEEDLQDKNNFINKNMKYICKKYYLNHMENRYINLYMERKQINDIKNSCRQAGFKLMDIKTDFDIIYGFSKEEDIEILQVGEINSVRMLVKNEKIEELEKLDLKLEDMEDRENFDFGDMKTFFCEEEDIRNIFQNEELENNINFLSKNNQLELGDLKNIKLKDVLVVVVLIGIYVFLNGMIPLGKQVEKNNDLKKQVKSLESEYLKEKNEKLPDYSEELLKLNEIDNGIKRKEYYSFIKFLVDNSINGIDYTKVKYENKKWLIQGEIENFDNFEKFESNVRKKYENSELGYIKDNDETTVFEYTVSEKE